MGTLSNTTTKTQCSEILAYLKTGKGITQGEAYQLIGTQRLPSRIWDLKQLGNEIVFKRETVKNRHGRSTSIKRYFLAEHHPENAVPVVAKVLAAQKRYEAAQKYFETRKTPSTFQDLQEHFNNTLKIAAGIK